MIRFVKTGFLFISLVLAAPGWSEGFVLTSPAFTAGGTLPVEFTCDGQRQSPPLAWSGVPAGTVAFAITMDHIPGPGDRHVYWVEYGIPGTQTSVGSGSHTGGTWGINTVDGRATYSPPCSKGPGAKEYTFTVRALSAAPTFADPAKVTYESLEKAVEGRILATAQLTVTYERAAGAEKGPPPPPRS